MDNLELFAVVLGDSSPSERMFGVEAPRTISVDKFKELVYARRPKTFARFDAPDLVLWKLNTAIHVDQVDKEVAAVGQDPSTVAVKMLPAMDLSDCFAFPPPRKCLHIIVQLPSSGYSKRSQENDQSGPPLKQQRTNVDISWKLAVQWSRPIAAQSVPILWSHLQLPLTEEEKIPISQSGFDGLLTPFSIEARASTLKAEELATLFRISEEENAESLQYFFTYLIKTIPPTSGTEDIFHSTWDENISRVLQLVLSKPQAIRNSNHHTSTALKRPDYGLLVNNNCVFRGEEKGPDSSDDPKAKLVNKLIYTYHPLTYILGYYAIGTQVNFVAITSPPSTAVDLFNHDLMYKNDRIANVVHLIRLCGVISWMGERLEFRNRPEFESFLRPDGLTQMTIGAVVRKEFRHRDAVNRVSKLVEIYELLGGKQVPNVDSLHSFSAKPSRSYIMVTPVGMDLIPESSLEAFRAVTCVLQALKVMHSEPFPVYHRDIRQQNILKKRDSQEWFLIDWSDASTAPTRAATHLSEQEHSPRVRQDNHGAEVDIWGVGYYLRYLANRSRPIDPYRVTQLAARWMEDPTITAEAALNEMNESQHFFFASDTVAV